MRATATCRPMLRMIIFAQAILGCLLATTACGGEAPSVDAVHPETPTETAPSIPARYELDASGKPIPGERRVEYLMWCVEQVDGYGASEYGEILDSIGCLESVHRREPEMAIRYMRRALEIDHVWILPSFAPNQRATRWEMILLAAAECGIVDEDEGASVVDVDGIIDPAESSLRLHVLDALDGMRPTPRK